MTSNQIGVVARVTLMLNTDAPKEITNIAQTKELHPWNATSRNTAKSPKLLDRRCWRGGMRLGGRVSSPIPVLHPLILDADQSKKTTAPINQRRHGRMLEELKQS